MNVQTLSLTLPSSHSNQKPHVHHFPLNNQRHHPTLSSHNVQSTTTGNSLKPRPYHLNDFANNQFFIAKRKIDEAFRGQQPQLRNARSTNDLLNLFDQHTNRSKRQENKINKISSFDKDNHVSVVNLHVSPPSSITQPHDQSSKGLIRPYDVWSGVKNPFAK